MLQTWPIPPYGSDRKDRNADRSLARLRGRGVEEGLPCVICGSYTGPGIQTYVHVCRGGAEIADPAEPHLAERVDDEHSAGCLAFYPVGSSCLRRYPALRGYIVGRDGVRGCA